MNIVIDYPMRYHETMPGIFWSLPVCNVPLILAKQVYTVSATLVLDSSVFLRVCIDCLLLFRFPLYLLPFYLFFCRGLFLLQGKCAKKVVLHHMQQAGALEFLQHHETLLHNLWNFVHYSVHGSSSGWLLQMWENWLPLGTKIWTATEQQSSAWMPKGYGNPGRVSF